MTKRLIFASTKKFLPRKNHDAILRLLSALFHYLTMASCKETIVFAQKLFSFFVKKFLSQGKFGGNNAVLKNSWQNQDKVLRYLLAPNLLSTVKWS